MSQTSAPSTLVITPDNHGAIISIAVYFLMITFILSVIIRLVIRLAITRSLSKDDYICTAAMAVGIGQSVALIVGVNQDGLGTREKLLSRAQVRHAKQAQYASDLLYILALCLAKTSVLLLLQRLAVSRLHKRVALATAGVVVVWSIAGFVTLAAQCGAHLPWRSTSNQCIDIRDFWIGMAPLDIITELVMVILPVLMMIPVQVALGKKAVIVVAFIFRLMVIAATIVRLFFIRPADAPSSAPDVTFNAVNYNILTQIVLSVSITTACIPCLKPFLDGFESGFMAVTLKDHVPGGSGSHSRNYKMRDLAYGNTAGGKGRADSSMAMRSRHSEKMNSHLDTNHEEEFEDPRHKMGVSVEVVAANRDKSPRHNRRGNGTGTDAAETGSRASSSTSDQMIIKKNVQWTVQYEDAAPAPADANNRNHERSSSRRHSIRDESDDIEGLNHIGLHHHDNGSGVRGAGGGATMGYAI